MGRYGWNQRILAKSRISESRWSAGQPRDLMALLEYQGETEEALPLRLVLKPLEGNRLEPMFPAGTSIADIVAEPVVPGFRAGFQRSNAGAPPPNSISGTPIYAAIEWGVGESRVSRIACDWPLAGASIELVASNVKVWGSVGAVTVFLPGSPQLPNLGAELGPSQGMGYNDEPLTFTQLVDIRGAGGAVQVAIPEYARSVEVWCPDTMDPIAPDFYELSFCGMNPALNVICQTRLDFAAGYRQPVELSVPGKAVVLIVNGIGGAADMNPFLQWRIAP